MQGLLTDLTEGPTAYELGLSKQMADTLTKHFPGYLWGVQVRARQGIADIRNLSLAGNWGYRLKLNDHYTASDWDRQCMLAGGEILERFKASRRRADEEAIAHMPTDFAGRHRPDL